ncbi:MAG: FAD-dependent oxidoreductase [Victivallales bacterium]
MHDTSVTSRIPITREFDVLVIGGGPAGVAAGFAAARMGAKTMIVEQFNCLGGIATAGGHGHMCLYSAWETDTRVVGGIPFEMAERASTAGYGVCNNSYSDFEVEGMKLVLENMAEECGVDLLYHSFFSDAIVENGTVKGVVIQNKSGRHVILAKRIIDCTGDGDVAARAGCEYEQGEKGTGLCQPVTLMFTIGGVDVKKFSEFQRIEGYKMENVWKRAQDSGDMRPFQSTVMGWWFTPTRPDQLGVNFTHVTGIDTTNASDLTKATIEARKQAYESIAVFRKYVCGLENCHMISTPSTIGTRESRRITGEYVLTKEDVLGMKDFEDSIGYGSFFIDIHNCSGIGMDQKTVRPAPGLKYQIPYRIIVPQKIDNLLVAGRCASCTHEALGSLRVMPQCGVMGQAAGVASVISLRDNVTPRKVNIKKLQAELKKQDCIVDGKDIENANRKG